MTIEIKAGEVGNLTLKNVSEENPVTIGGQVGVVVILDVQRNEVSYFSLRDGKLKNSSLDLIAVLDEARIPDDIHDQLKDMYLSHLHAQSLVARSAELIRRSNVLEKELTATREKQNRIATSVRQSAIL